MNKARTTPDLQHCPIYPNYCCDYDSNIYYFITKGCHVRHEGVPGGGHQVIEDPHPDQLLPRPREIPHRQCAQRERYLALRQGGSQGQHRDLRTLPERAEEIEVRFPDPQDGDLVLSQEGEGIQHQHTNK